MKNLILLIVLSIVFFFPGCGKSEKAEADSKKSGPEINVLYVTAAGGLRLRDKPDTGGKVVETIPEGDKVELIETTGAELTISGASGKWSKIKWKDKTGWGFGGFLSDKSKSAVKSLLPDSLIKSYAAGGQLEPGNMPNRITIGKYIIVKYSGGSMTGNAYCIIDKVDVKGKAYSITCSARALTEAETKEYLIEQSASKLSNIEIKTAGAGSILVDKETVPYKQGSGL